MRVVPAAGVRRVLPARRERLEGFVADPPQTEPFPVDHCGICDFKPLCDAHWDAVDHLCRVAGIQRAADREAPQARGRDARRARRARATTAAGREWRTTTFDEAPRAGRSSSSIARERGRGRATSSCRRRPTPASRCCPIRRRATSSSTSRATRSGTSEGSLEYLWGHPRRGRRLHAAAARRPRRGAARVRGVRRPRPRAARARTPTCTSTTTRRTRSRRCGG